MATSNNFGEYLSRTYHGWFLERLRDMRTFINQAFVNSEGGLKRNTIPLCCVGSSTHDWAPIVIDAIQAHSLWIAAYQINYGLGYWDVKAGVRLYGLEGSTSKTYTALVGEAPGNNFVLSFNATTKLFTILVPADNSGTLAGLRAALLAGSVLREKFAVSGEDVTTLIVADAMVATVITAPAAWGTGVAAMLAMNEIYFERLEPNWAKLYMPADVTLGGMDAFLPCTIHVEVWNDGQLMEFRHLAIAAAVE